MNKIEIPLSNTKILLLLLAGVAFVIIGALFIIDPEEFVSPFKRSPEMIRIGGIASVLFFGPASIYAFLKLIDTKMGLSVDEVGIYDNTNATSVGLIKWTDITEIKTGQVASTKYLLILIHNPVDYINRMKGFQRKISEANNKIYGTPLSISSNTLKYDFNDLERLLKERFSEHCQKRLNS